MSLSIKNQWIDKENRVYIIFTLENVMELFFCSERKASYLMKELDSKSGSGLIEKKRQGLGKPNLIYVKNVFASESKAIDDDEKTFTMIKSENKNGKTMPVKNSENVQLKSCKEQQLQTSKSMQVKSSEELQTNNTENNKTENSEIIYSFTNHKNEIDTMDIVVI